MKLSGKKRRGKTQEKTGRKLSRKQILVICCILAAVIAAAAAVWFWTSRGKTADADGTAAADNSTDTETDSGQDAGESENGETDGGSGEDGAQGGASDSAGDGNASAAAGGAGSEAVLQDGVHGLTLPYSIPGSSLVVRGIASYDGIYLEDGSDEEISGVTVMLLQNAGDTEVEYASVSVSRDGTALQFDASALPAGGTVVVQEKNKTPFQEGNYADCSATVAEISGFEMSEDKVQVEESGEQSLTVTNLTDEDIPAVRVFYKFYMEDEGTYVGGITYTAKITNLAAGASQTITPSHYVQGSSRVMMVRTYDTVE